MEVWDKLLLPNDFTVASAHFHLITPDRNPFKSIPYSTSSRSLAIFVAKPDNYNLGTRVAGFPAEFMVL